MKRALVISPAEPAEVYRIAGTVDELTVLVSEAERKADWLNPRPAKIKILVADVMLIDITIQKPFAKAFDLVYCDPSDDAAEAKAEEFLKHGGNVEYLIGG